MEAMKKMVMIISVAMLILNLSTIASRPEEQVSEEVQVLSEENLADVIQRLGALYDSSELDRLITKSQSDIANSSVSGEKHYELGILLAAKALFETNLKAGKSSWSKAIHELEKAVNLTPKLAEAHSVLGHLYLCPFVEDTDALRKSKMHFQKALQLDTNQTVAKEGLRRIALRSSKLPEKEQEINKRLDELARATRSGRKFSILSVKAKDSLQANDLIVELKVADVTKSAIIDSVEAMKLMGGVPGAGVSSSTSHRIISSIIQMIAEVSGMTYSSISALALQLDRVGIILHVQNEGPIRRMLFPVSKLKKMAQGQISDKEFFSSVTYINE